MCSQSLHKGEYERKRLEEKDSVCDRQDASCVNVLLEGVSLGFRLLNKIMLKTVHLMRQVTATVPKTP